MNTEASAADARKAKQIAGFMFKNPVFMELLPR
jgi:hypothetical protein